MPLANTYLNPVVVCSVNYTNNTLPVVTRVSNVTAQSFDVRLQNPSGSPVVAEDVSYMVVEEGVYTEADHGVTMEAVKFTSTVTDRKNSWNGQLRSYANTYSRC